MRHSHSGPNTDTSVALTRPLRWLLAPLHALERSRGWRRLVLLVLELLVLGVVLGLAWWSTSLMGLPDIGDPFDVAAFARETAVPPERNAYPLYQRACEAMRQVERDLGRISDWNEKHWPHTDWSTADPLVQRFVIASGEALSLWLEGSQRPDAALADPLAGDWGRGDETPSGLRELSRLAALEASRRLQVDQDPAGAWTLYRGVLRTSRHMGRYAAVLGAFHGKYLLESITGPIQAWADDPAIEPALLRQALADVQAVRTMTARNSIMLKFDYAGLKNWLLRASARELLQFDHNLLRGTVLGMPLEVNWEDLPTWWVQGYLRLYREPERALRISRLYFARWLAECDKPVAERLGYDGPPGDSFLVFRVGAEAPEAVRVVDEPTLRRWIESSPLASIYLSFNDTVQPVFDRDQQLLDTLTIILAEALYQREHGEPAPSLGALVGPDLPRLPESYEGIDPPESVVLPGVSPRR